MDVQQFFVVLQVACLVAQVGCLAVAVKTENIELGLFSNVFMLLNLIFMVCGFAFR